MKNKLILAIISALFILTGCSSIPTDDITVEADSAPGFNLASYKTYYWLGSISAISDSYGQWKPPGFDTDVEIQRLIAQELGVKGLTETESNPDVFAIFLAGINMDALEGKIDSKLKSITISNIPKGALMIGLVDSKTEELVWAGVAQAEIQEDIPAETVKKRLDYAVSEIFKKLPE
jgi:PBP1b-binding outer membrane lipoprotein LpoB